MTKRWAWMVVLGWVAACASEPLTQLGDRCVASEECESGLCEDAGFCTTTCATDDNCFFGDAYLVCDTGQCRRPCSTGEVRGTGASREVCTSGGHFTACSADAAARVCNVCGCEPFGGGTCTPGVGCFVPMPDGSPCTRDAECDSGACYRDTNVCGAPRGMGEPCSADAECETLNCSTDGDDTMVGHCNQELGTRCTSPTRDRLTPTCTQCMFTFGVTDGICFREACNPVTANHCQSFSGHEFRCDRSTSGNYRCFEVCDFAGDDCWYDGVSCYTEGDYCR